MHPRASVLKRPGPLAIGLGLVLLPACFSSSSGSSTPAVQASTSAGGDPVQAQIELGRKLFFDERLSVPTGISCGTCHDPFHGWSDGRPQGKGVQDHTLDTGGHDENLAVQGNYFKTILTGRNTPTVYNTHNIPNLFWDGRAGDLVHQANFPVEGFNEMNSSWAEHVLPLLEADPQYPRLFQRAYGPDAIDQANAVAAMGAYEATIQVFDTPYDQFVGGDPTALTAQEKEGHDLFFGAAGCHQCHPASNLTDFGFHNTGVPNAGTFALNGDIDFGRGKFTDLTQDPPVDVDNPLDYCKFKTPQLRMIGVTGPYMHNGAFETLEEVVEFYDQGGGADLCGSGNKSPLLVPLGLTQSQKDALVAFLRTGLTGTEIK